MSGPPKRLGEPTRKRTPEGDNHDGDGDGDGDGGGDGDGDGDGGDGTTTTRNVSGPPRRLGEPTRKLLRRMSSAVG